MGTPGLIMMVARILALDPGPTSTGYALVQGGLTPRVRFIEGGQIDSSCSTFLDLVRDLGGITAVAVERPAGYVYDPVRGKHVVATSNVAGGLAWAAQSLGLAVYEIPAGGVRKTLLGKTRLGFKQAKGDMDRAVKDALPLFVDALPARSNSHVRDAIAVAVAANFVVLSKQPRRNP